jgi:predicted  nucleic acid-binding Zn-ribbon protein
MTAFLMLFAEYRALVLRADEAEERVHSLGSDMAALRRQLAEAEAELRRVNEEHKADLRKIADHQSRKADGRYVFARAEAPVPATMTAPPKQSKVFARDVVNQRNRAALSQMMQDLQGQPITDPPQPTEAA